MLRYITMMTMTEGEGEGEGGDECTRFMRKYTGTVGRELSISVAIICSTDERALGSYLGEKITLERKAKSRDVDEKQSRSTLAVTSP